MTAAAATPTRPATSFRWWRDRHHLPWWRIPLYPVVFLDALVLLTWGHAGLHVALVARPLIVATVATLVVTFACAAVFRDRDRAGLVASAIALIVLTVDDRAAIMLALVVIVVSAEGLLHRGRPAIVAGAATRILAIMAVILATAVGIDLAQVGAWQAAADDLRAPSLPPLGATRSDAADIYIFLLDGYPGDRAAARATSFDADAFSRALQARGFDVVRDAHSNYLLTPLTLATMLSMRHIADMPTMTPSDDGQLLDFRALNAVLRSAPALAIARDAGVRVTVIDSGFGHARMGGADHFIEFPLPEELELVLNKDTRLASIIEAVAPGTRAAMQRARIEATFRAATEPEADGPGPRLTFVHVPAPHPPWVFDAKGGSRDPKTMSFAGEPGSSVQAQLDSGFAEATHIAEITVSTIDTILRSSPREPVIVVFSDHGPGGDFSTDDPFGPGIEVRASSFMAALTPGHPGLIATDRPTPVNLFGVLFNAYLGTSIARQPDSIWAWRGDSYIDVVEAPPIEGWTQ